MIKRALLVFALSAACSNDEPAEDRDVDASVPLACSGQLARPDAVKSATRSPDGKGFCCAPTGPTCNCGLFGAFVKDRCECGSVNNGACDLAPPDWIATTDEHGCNVYTGRFPQTACCNCPRDASVAQ